MNKESQIHSDSLTKLEKEDTTKTKFEQGSDTPHV